MSEALTPQTAIFVALVSAMAGGLTAWVWSIVKPGGLVDQARTIRALRHLSGEQAEQIARLEAALDLTSRAALGMDVDYGDVVWNYLRTRPDGDVLAQMELDMQLPDGSDET